jgi:hypothetical protein
VDLFPRRLESVEGVSSSVGHRPRGPHIFRNNCRQRNRNKCTPLYNPCAPELPGVSYNNLSGCFVIQTCDVQVPCSVGFTAAKLRCASVAFAVQKLVIISWQQFPRRTDGENWPDWGILRVKRNDILFRACVRPAVSPRLPNVCRFLLSNCTAIRVLADAADSRTWAPDTACCSENLVSAWDSRDVTTKQNIVIFAVRAPCLTNKQTRGN